MQTFCRDDAAEILREIGYIGLDKCMNAIAKEYQLSERFLLQMGHQLDIYTLSGLIPMSVRVYEKYYKRLQWEKVSELIKLDHAGIDFVMKHLDMIDIPTIIRRMEQHPDEGALSYLIDIAIHNGIMTAELWDIVSHNMRVSSKFMRKYELYLNWYILSENRNIPEDLILKYANKLNWRVIWNTRHLTEATIKSLILSAYAECAIDWCLISSTQELSEEFLELYKEELDWCIVSEYQKMSYKFLIYHRDRICLDRLLKNHAIDQATIDKYVATFDDPNVDPDPDDDNDLKWEDFVDGDPEIPAPPIPNPPTGEGSGSGSNSGDMEWEGFN